MALEKTVYIDFDDVDKPIAIFSDDREPVVVADMPEIYGDFLKWIRLKFPDYRFTDIRWKRP